MINFKRIEKVINISATEPLNRNCIILKVFNFRPNNAKDGDHLILTKALGTQLATNAYLWLKEKNEKYLKISEQFTDNDIINTYKMAINSMSYLNRNGNYWKYNFY